jgi:integrase
MRVGEAMGLVWSDVQPAELTVTRQLNRSRRRGALKTGRSARRIDLSAQLAAKLREHRIASPCSGDHDPVFVRRDGTPYSRSVVLRVIRNAADAAGLEGVKVDDEWIVPPLTCHSHISALIAAGWDVQEVADRPGDTGGTIMTEYSHQFDAARRAQSRRDRLDIMEAPMEAPVSTGRPSVTPEARSNVAPLRRSDAG